MAEFNYQAVTSDGTPQSGALTAETATEASERIFAMNLTPVEVTPKGIASAGGGWSGFRSRYLPVSARDLIMFTKQLVTMNRVGIPIIKTLEVLEQQTEHPRLRRLAGNIRVDVQNGASLSEAMGKHPKIFTPLYCSVVQAGEASGTLPQVLDRLLYLIEHEAMIRAEVKTAFRYPVMVIGALCLAFVILLGFVIPRFVVFFENAGIDLPLPTRICIALSEYLLQYGPWALLGLGIAAFFARRYLRTENGQFLRDYALLRLPLVGPVLIKASMSRFASIFAILQASGIMVLESLRILSNTVGNVAISREFDHLRDSLEEGRGISQPLRDAHYFPPMLVNMVAIGEESGQLDEMLLEISTHYDMEVRYTMKKMSDTIGPVLIIGLTAVVGFFALAIYMPMWDLTQMAAQKAR